MANRTGRPGVAVGLCVADEGGLLTGGWAMGPNIRMPTPEDIDLWLELFADSPDKRKGWHAVAVCGYDDGEKKFEFKNSWGSNWGDQGFGLLPYEYVNRYARTALWGWV